MQLQRLYWFTIEFGIIGASENPLIYGAGILSSYGETNEILNGSKQIIKFEMEKVLQSDFRTDIIQQKYFLIPDLKFLYESFKNHYTEISVLSPSD